MLLFPVQWGVAVAVIVVVVVVAVVVVVIAVVVVVVVIVGINHQCYTFISRTRQGKKSV